jgi:glycosyltransferase involved in cell wall biosynthesis
MNNRVWIVSEFYYPDENATGYLLTRIAEDIAHSEEVRILCGPLAYAQDQSESSVYTHHKVFIERVDSSTFNKDFLFLRLINNITLSFKILIRLIKELNPQDKVLVVTNPPSLPFVAAIACRWKKALYFVLVFDIYPEVLVAAGVFNKHNPMVYLMKRMTRILFSKAQKVIVLGRDMYGLLQRNYRVACDRLVVIPNWGEVNVIKPKKIGENAILKELSISNKFVVQYVGNIGRTHNVELLLECAELLKDKTDICFLFIGDGAKKKWLTESVEKRNLNNVIIQTFYSRERQSDVHNACDIAVVSFIPGMAGISVPSRIYNIMAAGKPILAITDPESELAMVVQEENIGWVVTSYRARDVVDNILAAHGNNATVFEMGKRARKAAEAKYSFDKIIPIYRNVIMKHNA